MSTSTALSGITEPRPGRLFYFTYGTNLHEEQLRLRDVRPASAVPACLADYRLDFFGHAHMWDGGMETVVPAPGHRVWGVVHDLSGMAADRLDAWQDARFDGAGAYFHYPVTVTAPDGTAYAALTYKKDILGSPMPPSGDYMAFLMAGARQNGLPEEWLAVLRGIPTRQAGYAVPRHSPFNRGMLADVSCASCDG